MAPLDLSQISLRSLPGQGADRGIILGGSGYGKSELEERLGQDWDARYWHKKGKRLVIDRKPRFQAQYLTNGLPAKRLYKNWDHGQYIPGSVLCQFPEDLDLAWSLNYHVAICQGSSDADNPRMLAVAQRFHDNVRASQPQLLCVDEMLYFFSTNGMPKGGSDILKTYAVGGRERGLASLFCSQRTKGFPGSILEEINRAYIFGMDYIDDIKRLGEFGCPIDEDDVPEEEFDFRYWYKRDRKMLYGPYRLDLPKS